MTADVHTMTGAYSVNALPDDERRHFEAHLVECAACRQEVEEMRRTAARLGAAAHETPPPSLRANVLAQIDVTRQEAPSNVTELRRRRATRTTRLVAAAAAIFAITAASLGGVTARQSSRIDMLETAMVRSTDVLAAADARTITLDAPEGVTARVVYSATRGEGVFLAHGLAALPADQVYELWLIGESGATPAGLFLPTEDGRVLPHVMTGDLRATTAFGVTIEPAGGSPEPTSTPIILGSVA